VGDVIPYAFVTNGETAFWVGACGEHLAVIGNALLGFNLFCCHRLTSVLPRNLNYVVAKARQTTVYLVSKKKKRTKGAPKRPTSFFKKDLVCF